MKLFHKILILVTLTLFPSILPGQSVGNSINLNLDFAPAFSEIRETDAGRTIRFPEFDDVSKPGSPNIPVKIIYVALPPNSKISSHALKGEKLYTIENVLLSANQEVTRSSDTTITYIEREIEIGHFKGDKYPEGRLEVLGYVWLGNFYCAAIKINTHSFNWRKRNLEIISEAELELELSGILKYSINNKPLSEFESHLKHVIANFSEAQAFRSSQPINVADTDDWIDYSQNYMKFRIPFNGIYKLSHKDLTSYGLSTATLDPSTLKMYFRGVEQPILVIGEEDGTLDPTDYILFYATQNLSEGDYRELVDYGDEYINYMDRYTDTSTVWLTWGGDAGLRMSIEENNSIVPQDTIKQHKARIHLEEDTRLWYHNSGTPRGELPFYYESKAWTWIHINHRGTRTFTTNCTNVVPDGNLDVLTRFISHASPISENAHKFTMRVNNTPSDTSVTFNFRDRANLRSDFSSNELVEGQNNIYIIGQATDATFHQALIDWIDIEYDRYNVAENDSIYLSFSDEMEEKLYAVTLEDYSDFQQILAFQIKPKLSRLEFFVDQSGSEHKLIMQDTISTDTEYLVIDRDKIRTPVFVENKRFPNLRNAQRSAEYLIISHKDLESSAEQYSRFIGESYHVETAVIYVNEIYDEFSYGQKSAEAIKEFVKASKSLWSKTPEYLLIIGDANYDYRHVVLNIPEIKEDLVPSYGVPVSDAWYVTNLSGDSIDVPQMSVGRIPAKNNDEVLRYLEKHELQLNRDFDGWNKKYLFFSGGNSNNTSELEQLKNVNDQIISSLAKPAPIGGETFHFYKTLDPVSNLGDYTLDEYNDIIYEGGLMISYIGHSGTRTWDNGITEVDDLQSGYPDRQTLITDFGCSTARFAEPDVEAFGELFICRDENGQSIDYVGNSSFGFLSTALTVPQIFYEQLLTEGVVQIGLTHLLSKIKLFEISSFTDLNQVYLYSSTLMGDPIISMKLPPKPNLYIDNSLVEFSEILPSDDQDSIIVTVLYKNTGRVEEDSISIHISDWMGENVVFEKQVRTIIPLASEEIQFNLPVKFRAGEHVLKISLDPENNISEIFEDDNYSEINYTVATTSLKPIITSDYYSVIDSELNLLNPSLFFEIKKGLITLEVSENPDVLNPNTYTKNFDTLVTSFSLGDLDYNKRYWWRMRTDLNNNWSKTYSHINSDLNLIWQADSTLSLEDFEITNVNYNESSKQFELGINTRHLKITSAGSSDGRYASIEYNGFETLPNTFVWGFVAAVLNPETLEPEQIEYFVFPREPATDKLVSFIDNLNDGTLVAMAVSDDAYQSVLGGSPSRAGDAIKQLGSVLIDSVGFRESWSMLGMKGAEPGSVIEFHTKQFEGPAVIDTSTQVLNSTGHFTTPWLGPSTNWQYLKLNADIPDGAEIQFIPMGLNPNGTFDTLSAQQVEHDSISISDIDASMYSHVKFNFQMNSSPEGNTPIIKTIGAEYIGAPELAINYQVIDVFVDTLIQEETNKLRFYVYNVGESDAENFDVTLNLVRADNSVRRIESFYDVSINHSDRIEFESKFQVFRNDGWGEMAVDIVIDADNKITELYEDNNSVRIPFYVIEDTTVTSLNSAEFNITFDGYEISDGDYVSPNPEIEIEVNYPGWFPVSDTSSMAFYFDGAKIESRELLTDESSMAGTRKYIYRPALDNGTHFLKIYGADQSGTMNNYPGLEKIFEVSDEIKLLDVYNYPNPFSENTDFTFQLTQIPDELKIKIYTVAGRLIKVIEADATNLKTNFNSLPWDGRDEDGDVIANGVYLYKIIARSADKTSEIIQKLAVVR